MSPETDCPGPQSVLQFHLLFLLADFSDRIGKTKRTGYESGDYEMVCYVLCVNGDGAEILFYLPGL